MKNTIVKNTITNEVLSKDFDINFIEILDKGCELYIDGGNYIKATQEEIDAFNAKIELDVLQKAKDAKIAELDVIFNEVLNTTIITINGKNLKIDDNTRIQLMQILISLDPNGINKTAFGDAITKKTIELTKDELTEYVQKALQMINGIPNGLFPKRRAIKEEIQALQNIDEVNAYDIKAKFTGK